MNDKTDSSDKEKPGFFRRMFGRPAAPDLPKDTDAGATPASDPPDGGPMRPDVQAGSPAAYALEHAPPGLDVVVVERPDASVADKPAPALEPHPAPGATSQMDATGSALGALEVASPEPPAEPAPEKASWWSRLKSGLSRSSSSIGTGIAEIFTKRKLDDTMLEELEDVLIRADLGVATASRIADAVRSGRFDRDVSPDEVKAILAAEVERVLTPSARPIELADKKPFVILVVGVNGSGKTTTIGKLTAKFTAEGRKVMLAAGDTFRAAAIAQLRVWGDRAGCPVIAREQGSDAAGLAFEAIQEAKASGMDILLMDTAGRLQNRSELMAELEKIIRVMRKLDAEAPHAVLLVLDATIGQNAMSQVEIFGKVAGVTGLVMTKLDGTARGGILVAICDKYKLPVHFIGVGETAEHLEPFSAHEFSLALVGKEREPTAA